MTVDAPERPAARLQRERKPPPNAAQRKAQLDALCRALDTICEAWPDALAAMQARGYPHQSPGPKAAAGIVRPDPKDPLHAREMPGASTSASAFGDQTGNSAIQDDAAGRWIRDATACLRLLLRMSPADEWPWNGSARGIERSPRHTGPWWPPYLQTTLRRAAADVVELWPVNCALLFERIHKLANTARVEWPPTLHPGATVIDKETGKEIVVGATHRAKSGEDCTECGRFVAGDASDPICRIDGKPYHRTPCYNTVYKRNKRSASGD